MAEDQTKTERPLVAIYATRNRRAPIIGLIGDWPHNSGMFRMAMAGVRFFVRHATEAEAEAQGNFPRHLAVRWQTIRGLLFYHCEDLELGIGVARDIIQAMRPKRLLIRGCLEDGKRREKAYRAKRANVFGKPLMQIEANPAAEQRTAFSVGDQLDLFDVEAS